MPGRPDFSQPGTKGASETVAVQERPEIKDITAHGSGDIASGDTEVQEVYAPTGKVYDLVAWDFHVDGIGSATSGNHLCILRTVGDIAQLRGNSNYDTRVRWFAGYWKTANVDKEPPDHATAKTTVQAVQATENAPIKVEYRNQTDATQTDTRNIYLVVEETGY